MKEATSVNPKNFGSTSAQTAPSHGLDQNILGGFAIVVLARSFERPWERSGWDCHFMRVSGHWLNNLILSSKSNSAEDTTHDSQESKT